MPFNRVIVIVLDSLGCGAMPDAAAYGDAGSNTLGHLAAAVGGLKAPHLGALGLGNIIEVAGVPPAAKPRALYGKCTLAAPNKDTISGHWEMMGCVLKVQLRTYPKGFPKDLLDRFMREAKVDGILANTVASGTEVIAEYGDEHVKTGFPIVYTSADSVFQIAAHEQTFGLERLYQVCEAARRVCRGDHEIGRVIARPFIGEKGRYTRTANRHDYALTPPEPTVLDALVEKGVPVLGIGKIKDIFADRGVPDNQKTKSNADGIAKTLEAMRERPKGFIFTNLVDFDMLFGHRQDAPGYAKCIEEFDAELPRILAAMTDQDLLFITADHGNDPTDSHTDHCREYCPLLVYHKGLGEGRNVGVRKSLADIGATVAKVFGVKSGAGEPLL